MEKEKLHKYIAVAIAVAIFGFIFFGGRIFPQLYIFDLFSEGVFRAQNTVKGTLSSGNIPVRDLDGSVLAPDVKDIIVDESLTFDISALSSVLADLPDLVSHYDVRQGDGGEAIKSRTVSIGYRGTYIDKQTGEEVLFDKNTDRSSPFTFTLGSGEVIPGFDIGVSGMREGGIRLIIIKPEAGYGNRQVGPIPPNTTLIFVIELYEVR